MSEKKHYESGSIVSICVFIASIFASVLFSAILKYVEKNQHTNYIVSMLLQITMFLALLICHFLMAKKVIDVASYKKTLSIKETVLVLVILVLVYGLFFPISSLWEFVLLKTGYNFELASGNNYLGTNNLGLMFFGLFTAGIIAPLVEESIFRVSIGYAYKDYGYFRGALLSALVFGLFHGGPAQFVFQFGLGLVACLVYYITKSFWSSFMMHSCSNGFLIILLYIKQNKNSESTNTEIELLQSLSNKDIIMYIFIAVISFILLINAIYLLVRVSNKRQNKEVRNLRDTFVEAVNVSQKMILKEQWLLIISVLLLFIPWVLNFVLGYVRK